MRRPSSDGPSPYSLGSWRPFLTGMSENGPENRDTEGSRGSVLPRNEYVRVIP